MDECLSSPLDQFEETSDVIAVTTTRTYNQEFDLLTPSYFNDFIDWSQDFNGFGIFNITFITTGLLMYFLSMYTRSHNFVLISLFSIFVLADYIYYGEVEYLTENVNLSGYLENNDSSLINIFNSDWLFVVNQDAHIGYFPVYTVLLSVAIILFLHEDEEDNETVIPTLSGLSYKPFAQLNEFFVTSTIGKNIPDKDDLYAIIAGIFAIILMLNVQGMIPYTYTTTSSLVNTIFISLSIFIFILANMLRQKGVNHLLNLFMPHGCPIALVPLLIPIELVSYSFRLISLSVRLFANMMAGHTLLKVLVGFSWNLMNVGTLPMLIANVFLIVVLFLLVVLEFGVAFIQAYVYSVLTCLYIRDIYFGH